MRSPDIVIRSQKVLVRGLRLEAFIGIHDHERDSSQLLLVDVEVDLGCERIEAISGAFNYEAVVLEARKIVSQGHIDLVETFAEPDQFGILSDRGILGLDYTLNHTDDIRQLLRGL